MTYPAREPPTQGKVAGVKAGAFPPAGLPSGPDGGDGLLRICMKGASCRKGVYGSYEGARRSRRGVDWF